MENKEVFESIFIILGLVAFYMIFKYIMINTVFKKAKKSSNKKALTTITVATNVVKYVFYIGGTLMILDVWGIDTKAMLASLGIVGIIVGLSLQDLLKDIIGGTAILTEDQFKVGDNIKIGDFRGEVISLGLKATKIKAYTGEVKIIANRNINEVINYSIYPAKSIITIDVPYEEDIEKIKQTLEKIYEKVSNYKQYVTGEIKTLGIEEIDTNKIKIKISAETYPNKDAILKRIILEEIVKEFKAQDIKLPCPKLEVKHEK